MDNRIFHYQPLIGQATLKEPVRLIGDGGFFNQQAAIELRPAEPNTGLVFVWNDQRFTALVDHISPSPSLRTTILAPLGMKDTERVGIYTVEHLLSALYGLGVTNCEIHVEQNGLIPFFDGSAHEFSNRILAVGLTEQSQYYRRAIYCQQKIRVEHGQSYIEINPPTTSGLKVTADIDFAEPIGAQSLSYVHSPRSYCLNIAWARTFATQDFVSEEITKRNLPSFRIEKRSSGYVDSTMLVFSGTEFITTLRRNDEHIRHKVLDFIGDIALLGSDLYGDVTIHRPGHALNWEFVRTLHSQYNSESLKVDEGGPAGPKYTGDKSRYVRDVTLLEGDLYGPDATLVKTWEIANVGTVPWEGRRLIRIGPCSGYGVIRSAPFVPIPRTEPGQTVQISVEILTPTLQGWYVAEWKMIDAGGDYVFPNRYPVSVVLRVGSPLDEVLGP